MEGPDFINSRAEMEQFLNEEVLGYLGLCSDGQPYVVPLNYAYVDGKIIFHCALEGKKLDDIRRNPRVSFAISRQTGEVRDHTGAPCHLDSDSVICFGLARLVEDFNERAAVLNAFNRHYRPEAADLATERVQGCMAVEITVTEMTGRQERSRKRTYWRYRF
jgi:hypothetical protein